MSGTLESDLVLGYPLGICQRHASAKIDVDGAAHCLRCDAEMAAAAARPHGVVVVADPGHEAMAGLKTSSESESLPPGIIPQPRAVKQTVAAVAGGSFEHQVGAALAALQACPMPKDLKAYKAVAKARAILEKLIAPEQEK